MPGTIIFSILCLLMALLQIWGVHRQYKTIQIAERFTQAEKAVLTRQMMVFLPLLSLPFLMVFFVLGSGLTLSTMKAFLKIASWIIYPTVGYIAISALKNRVSFSRGTPVKGGGAIVSGILLMVGLVFMTVFMLVVEFLT